MFRKQGKAKYITTIDLTREYWQMSVAESWKFLMIVVLEQSLVSVTILVLIIWSLLLATSCCLGRSIIRSLRRSILQLNWELELLREDNALLTRWSLSLQPYQFTVHHHAGKTNANPDALSCVDYSTGATTRTLFCRGRSGEECKGLLVT